MWVGLDGFPLSWRHFKLGQKHLNKARARDKLDMFSAVQMAQSTGEGRDEWVDNQERIAGYKHR